MKFAGLNDLRINLQNESTLSETSHSPKFASLVFPVNVNQLFEYSIPPELAERIKPGMFVQAELRNKSHTAFVLSVSVKAEFPGKHKAIQQIDPQNISIPEELIDSLKWLADYYLSPLGMVLKSAFPKLFSEDFRLKKEDIFSITASGKETLKTKLDKAPKMMEFLTNFKTQKSAIPISEIENKPPHAGTIARKLVEKGYLQLGQRLFNANPLQSEAQKARKITLTSDQQNAVDKVQKAIAAAKFAAFLLYGVTGSGKTEVYLELARKVLKDGRAVIVLVPEISLTPQVTAKFHQNFGDEVAIWHSRMSNLERNWTWQKMHEGQFRVVIGARSAIFAPLPNLGLIVVDEEQENTFKQESPPRYNARDFALMRARNANAAVMLISATPGLESYFNAIQAKYELLELNKRPGKAMLPLVKIVDMKRGKRAEKTDEMPLFSDFLLDAIRETIARDEQVIILQNNRGYSKFQTCTACGFIVNCNACNVSLTYHRKGNKLLCHYCGHSRVPSATCEGCGENALRFVGAGTQKAETLLEAHIPGIRVLRMDLDQVGRKGSHNRILSAFREQKADVLVGTQMIAKGLNFENVTLVGVLTPDGGLQLPDFRAGERIFQLIYQVVGRAGRYEKPGQAIIQTYQPKDIHIYSASLLDRKMFYNLSLANRYELQFPPFSKLIRFVLESKDFGKIHSRADELLKIFKPMKIKILGPSPCPLDKIKENYRQHIILKIPHAQFQKIHRILSQKIPPLLGIHAGVKLTVDVDPYNIL